MNLPEKRVVLVMGMHLTHGRNLLRGIYAYSRMHKPWYFRVMPPDLKNLSSECRAFAPHGIIAFMMNQSVADSLLCLRTPLVNVSGVLWKLKTPRVGVDDLAVGKLAARHFLEKGFRHFGFLAKIHDGFSILRQTGFEKHLKSKGFSCSELYSRELGIKRHGKRHIFALEDMISQWMASLEKPVAILANNDQTGVQAINICQQIGLRVPEDVAILGVDDDELLCEMVHPALSSIKVPLQSVGYEAAHLLNRLMEGKAPPRRPILLPPLDVVTRQSTNVMAVTDPEVAKALQFIHEHACDVIQVDDVLESVTISRRMLENRFQAVLGRSPLQEIRRAHIERAKQLLSETDHSLLHVARACGYNSAARFCIAFRAESGETPGEYRRRFRLR
jgi:LacI family transcriptional regulator